MIREKYLEERIPRWFVFGTYPDGAVDVSNGARDVAVHVTEQQALELIRIRDIFVDTLIAACNVHTGLLSSLTSE